MVRNLIASTKIQNSPSRFPSGLTNGKIKKNPLQQIQVNPSQLQFLLLKHPKYQKKQDKNNHIQDI